jgi:hypothetical protein
VREEGGGRSGSWKGFAGFVKVWRTFLRIYRLLDLLPDQVSVEEGREGGEEGEGWRGEMGRRYWLLLLKYNEHYLGYTVS